MVIVDSSSGWATAQIQVFFGRRQLFDFIMPKDRISRIMMISIEFNVLPSRKRSDVLAREKMADWNLEAGNCLRHI